MRLIVEIDAPVRSANDSCEICRRLRASDTSLPIFRIARSTGNGTGDDDFLMLCLELLIKLVVSIGLIICKLHNKSNAHAHTQALCMLFYALNNLTSRHLDLRLDNFQIVEFHNKSPDITPLSAPD